MGVSAFVGAVAGACGGAVFVAGEQEQQTKQPTASTSERERIFLDKS